MDWYKLIEKTLKENRKLVPYISVALAIVIVGIYAIGKWSDIRQQELSIKQNEQQRKIDAETSETHAKLSEQETRIKCAEVAEKGAIELLKTKAELSSEYKEAAKKDLYLRPDYESYFKLCLEAKGLKP
ncbi:MAG: hypothetical protein WAP74_04535 [Patescibacteria group bacterium]